LKVTSAIASYVSATCLEDFPPEAVHAAKGAIMDCLGCAVAGSREPLADILCQFVRANGGAPVASVVGRGFKTSAPDAALINGAMAHALDYDDITQITKSHPSAVLLPAALALAEETGATGQDVLLAYMLGFEVACSVGEALSAAYYDDLGWHPTGPLGALGAAVAASRILKLDQSQTAMAVSLAASQAAGLRQNFGTMTKPFHAGAAARAGVVAAKLAKGGFTAGADALEGRFGFIRAFSGGAGFDPDQVLNTLGKKCYLVESGIEVKKYPCCGSAHLALDAMFTMLKRRRIDPAQVERIEVKVDFDPPRSLIHSRPKAALEGKFSMEYCLAAALLDRHIGLGTFTDRQVLRPEAQALISRVHMYRIPGHEGQPSWSEGYHEVEVHVRDGQVLTEQAARANTGALRGVTLQEIQAKFRDCAAGVLSPSATQELLELLDRLEELPDASRLADLLRGDGAAGYS
jgi:2-methylcitrate dehydratase PrpD